MALLVRTRLGISAFSSACSLPISLDHHRGRVRSSASRTLGPGLAGGVFTIPAFRQPLQARALSTSKSLAKVRVLLAPPAPGYPLVYAPWAVARFLV